MSSATAYLKPLPEPDALTARFWQATAERRLTVQRCSDCGSLQFYPRPVCRDCSRTALEWVDVSGEGTVETFTVTHRTGDPAFASEVPYVFAIVTLKEGPRMTGNVIGVPPEQVTVGMPVVVTFAQVTPEVTLPQWKPV